MKDNSMTRPQAARKLSAAAALATVCTSALAHPGHHDAQSLLQAVWHWVSSPYHLAMLLATTTLFVVGRRIYKRIKR
jgi:hydrogenase/urease accessory protein HupE